MTTSSALILLTNDDGIYADGLRYLKKAVSGIGRVEIVAPAAEQSAVGHSITLYDPIRVHEINADGSRYGFGISGTPADSVKLALYKLLPRRPDLVISGINDGANVGINVLYSGTVSAATEAAILGVPSMAVSLAQKKDPPFDLALPHIRLLAEWVLAEGLPSGIALNVNIPALPPESIKGYKITRQALSPFRESVEPREDPRGNTYYWLSGQSLEREDSSDIDIIALSNGYVSVTPLFYDLTAHVHREELACALKKI